MDSLPSAVGSTFGHCGLTLRGLTATGWPAPAFNRRRNSTMASQPRQTPLKRPTTPQPESPVPAPDEQSPVDPNIDDPAPAPANSPPAEPVWPTP